MFHAKPAKREKLGILRSDINQVNLNGLSTAIWKNFQTFSKKYMIKNNSNKNIKNLKQI